MAGRDRILYDPRTQYWQRYAVYGVLIVACAFFIAPLYVMIVTSLKPTEELRGAALLSLPDSPTLLFWAEAWSQSCAGRSCDGVQPGFVNSVKITVPVVLISVTLGSINGYALCFWNIRHANIIFTALMLGLVIPVQVYIYPLVRLTSALGIFGSLEGVILLNIIFGVPLMTLIFRNYYTGLPPSLMKAARVDGCGFWQAYGHIILPLSKPVLLVAIIMHVTWTWNDYILGLVFAGRHATPITVLLNNIIGSQTGNLRYNVDMASALIAAMVPLTIFVLSGRLFARGITEGAIKG